VVKYFSGKDTVSAYLAVPEGNGPFPALILIHEWWGLNDWVKKNADDFADSGYVALAIDLYHGKSTASPDEARKLSGSVSQDLAATDLRSAFDYLRNMKEVDKNRIGSIGWCMGGGYSLRAALDNPELAVCIINYGRLVTDNETLKKINCPVLGIFGEKDQNITPDNVKEFEKSLNEADIKNKIIIYPGVGHAFMNPTNTTLYDEHTTRKAWNETYSFLNNNLKRESK
jgi:carboxymethylenebutenolidase